METTTLGLVHSPAGSSLRKTGRLPLAIALGAALSLAACGGDAEAEDKDGSAPSDHDSSAHDQPDAGEGDAEVPEPDPVFAVSTSLWTPDGTATSYVAVVKSLSDGPAVDLKQALEFAGGARAYGPERGNKIYVTSDENGTMTEVTFDEDHKPSPGRTVSFAHYGISETTGGNVHLFVSPSKAYFVSQDSLEIVVWNPEKMETVKTIPLDLEPAPTTDYVAFYPRPLVVDDQLVLISNEHDEEGVGIRAQVTVVDLERDRVVANTVDARCHGMVKSAVDANGDRYFASGAASAAVHFMAPKLAPAPCMLRIRKGEKEFDATWSRTFSDELGTKLWTGVTPGKGGKLYMQSIAEDAPAVLAGIKNEDPFEVADATPWSWYTLSDGDAEPVPFETDLETPPYLAPIPVDGKEYVSVWDNVDTTLIDLISGDAPREGLVVPGFVYNIVRIE